MASPAFLKLTTDDLLQMQDIDTGIEQDVFYDSDGFITHSWLSARTASIIDNPTHYFMDDNEDGDRYEWVRVEDIKDLHDPQTIKELRDYAQTLRREADNVLDLCLDIDTGRL